jgi:hypothetical protein
VCKGLLLMYQKRKNYSVTSFDVPSVSSLWIKGKLWLQADFSIAKIDKIPTLKLSKVAHSWQAAKQRAETTKLVIKQRLNQIKRQTFLSGGCNRGPGVPDLALVPACISIKLQLPGRDPWFPAPHLFWKSSRDLEKYGEGRRHEMS